MIEDVLLRCDACRHPQVASPRTAVYDEAGRIKVIADLPEGWRPSFGTSGIRCYQFCPDCAAKGAWIEDHKGVTRIYYDRQGRPGA